MNNRLTEILFVLLLIQSPTDGSEFVHIVTASPVGKELTRDGKTVVDIDGDRGFGQPTVPNGLWSEADGFHTVVPIGIRAYSEDGSTLVGDVIGEPASAVWRESSGVERLPERYEWPDITADGSAFVGWLRECEGGNCQGWIPTIWQQGEPIRLSETEFGAWDGYIRISDDGRSVAFMAGPTQATVSLRRWTNENGLVDLGVSPPRGFRTGGVFMSADGNTIAGEWLNQNGTRLWRWTADEGVTESESGYKYSNIMDMSADGETMVGLYGPDGWGDWENNRAFIWDSKNGMRDLQQVLMDEYEFSSPAETRMEHARGISDDRKTLLTYRRDNPFVGPWRLVKLDWPIGPPTDDGDMNFDDVVDATDVDLQMEAIRQFPKATFHDLDFSGQVNDDDLTHLIKNTLNTWFGDANLDGEFNSGDFTLVFLAGEYEDAIEHNSGWAEGDWDGDGDFTSQDMVKAFLDGGYELGPRPAAAVPEPSTVVLALMACLLGVATRSGSGRTRS